ncbi:DUF4126 domain-containing protein [Bradyrhizobium diazoefficiens]|nr:DUF4126 domain-containing protein [Bradyrhizobium diazoefficiens]MBR0852153.1 DUF4126 domain-containing protein [Bradyrhizobium diazoefficiens]
MSNSDLALSIALGVGLAAATGFRVFLPMLVASVAAYSGSLPVGEGFAWLATPAAMLMLGVAALLEVGAYFIPGVDNLLDVIAAPVAVIAGAVVSAATMADLPPMMKWTAAIVAGGGAAGLVHGVTAAVRAKSTVMTAGLGNSTVATAELGGSLLVSLLALAAPAVAFAIVILLLWMGIRLILRLRGSARRTDAPG